MTENWENYMSDEFIENELIENEYYFDDDLNIVDIDSIENEGQKMNKQYYLSEIGFDTSIESN